MNIQQRQPGNADPHSLLKDNPPGFRYILRSAVLKFTDSTLLYNNGKEEYCYDFAELYLPPTSAHPEVTRLSDYPCYVDTLLAAADVRIGRSKEGLPSARALSRQIYLIRHVLDWLRARGIYRLSDATDDDTRILLAQLAVGGWAHALSLESRWNAALDQVEAGQIDLSGAFHFKKEAREIRIETLLQPFWRKRLGWGGIAPITASAKVRLERLASKWPVTDGWTKRSVHECDAPSSHVLRNMMGWLNDLAALPASVDRFQHRATEKTTSSAKKIAKKASSRTANLQVGDAITLVRAALKLLYEIAPLLLAVYEDAQISYPGLSRSKRRDWFYASSARKNLEQVMGKPITNWTWSGGHPRTPTSYSLDEILAAVQGGCAIILAAMNARRQREICDRHLGVRLGDLSILDNSLGIYQCRFYIEKTYRDRHVFYVNRTSADALLYLERLKRACAPLGGVIQEDSSLFECGRFIELGPTSSSHFSFTEDNGRTRSLISFLKVAYPDPALAPEIASHMFRRFYAILYYHRYEHAELRALKQHLRHLDVAMTRVYVTDPSTRPLAEQISTALTETEYQGIGAELHKSLDDNALDIQSALDEMSKEKLEMAVEEIISGRPTGGGFSRIVQKLYRHMLGRVVMQSEGNASATGQIIGLFNAHGYQVKPMQHGQCHAPDIRRNLKGACEQNGVLAREHAEPRLCGKCPFHFNNILYLQNLEEQLNELTSDMNDFMLSPQQQERAQFDHKNLKKLIEVTQRQMEINAAIIKETLDKKKVFQA
jgi:hypothetical protein